MTPEQWRWITELYDRTRPLDSDARVRALEAEPTEIRQAVQELLEATENDPEFLEGGCELAGQAAALLQSRTVLDPGSSIGPYRITRLIGHGGMGEVYEAQRADGEFQQRVAIKVSRGGTDREMLQRLFVRERQVLANLTHPRIARLLDGGRTPDGLPYLVMEYIEGEPIDKYCERLVLPPEERLRLFALVCEAVQYAHGQNVIHRDIKPANILIGVDGQPKLTDFGIAKVLEASEGGSLTSVRMLTPEYASPEQLSGGEVSPAADVYSLGVVLSKLLPEPSRTVESTIARATSRIPAHRFQTVAEFQQALASRGSLFTRRNAIAAGAAAMATGAIAYVSRGRPPAPGSIAVVMVENLTGDSSLDWMDRGICELITAGLMQTQTQSLTVFSTERVRAAASRVRKDGGKLTPEQAQEIARGANADAYASGALFKLEAGFRLNLKAQNTGTGALLYSGTVEGANAQALFAMADKAVAAMLAQLSSASAGARPDSAAALTPNLEALQAYVNAVRYWGEFLPLKVIELTRHAVELDPDFAAAHWLLATAVGIGPRLNIPEGRSASMRALAASRKRRPPLAMVRLIEAQSQILDGRIEEAVRTLETAHREVPGDPTVPDVLSLSLLMANNFDGAIAAAEAAARLDPNDASHVLMLAIARGFAADLPGALDALSKYSALVPSNNWNVHATRGDEYQVNGRYEEALASYRAADQVVGKHVTAMLSRPLLIMGRIAEAEAYLEPGQAFYFKIKSDTAVRRGDLNQAVADLEEAILRWPMPGKLDNWAQWLRLLHAAYILLEQRQPEQVLAFAARIPSIWSPGMSGCAHLILGDDAAAGTDFERMRQLAIPGFGEFNVAGVESLWRIRALAHMGRHNEVIEAYPKTPVFFRPDARLDYSRALSASGQLAKAETELRWAIRLFLGSGAGPWPWQQSDMFQFMLARYYQAQVFERSGRVKEAAEGYKFFLSSFDKSAAPLAQISEARAAVKRLNGGG